MPPHLVEEHSQQGIEEPSGTEVHHRYLQYMKSKPEAVTLPKGSHLSVLCPEMLKATLENCFCTFKLHTAFGYSYTCQQVN